MSWWHEPSTKDAFVLSWVSTIITIVFAITGIAYYKTSGSAMCLVFGLENLVDFLSSLVVLWRFWAKGKMTREREKTLKRRELRASMAISLILMLLGMGVIGTSSFDIAIGPGAGYNLDVVLAMAGTSLFCFGGLALFKFQYANAMASESLYKDGVCSLIGTILAAALFTNTLIIRRRPAIWWLDPVVAMICGFSALFLGCHSIFVAWKHRRVPILQLSWWLMSRGDGKTYGKTRTSREDEKDDDDDDENDDESDGEETPAIQMTKKKAVEKADGSTKLSNEIV